MSPAQDKLSLDKAEILTKASSFSPLSPELKKHLKQLSDNADDDAIDKVISLFQNKVLSQEKNIWQQHPDKKNIEQYQNTFKALEQLYSLKSVDDRYSFIIVIPVADRPHHLKQCLDSILTLCKHYEYGGYTGTRYARISVLIADDSRDSDHMALHASYCKQFTKAGLVTKYFGCEEQLLIVNQALEKNNQLKRIISDSKKIAVASEFTHKGASVTRNITYLKLKQLYHHTETAKNTLIYFIDSDQEFCINVVAPSTNADTNTDNKHYAINYFYQLNEQFKQQNISVLTGKVVGDPPVSPSVMAGNFQQDVQNFLSSIAKQDPDHNCQHHQHSNSTVDDAAYHDMANLFGFANSSDVYEYHCDLLGKHNNRECFADFANKLQRFFYGEHPTRKTHFEYGNGFSKSTPARTVYTGNYVIKPEMLDEFIPFATLKLRMAGPVLGRIFKNTLQHRFVSANLPMLHNRTVEKTGQSEFRPGVSNISNTIDLGNEFIRQFYGDIMLFTIEAITETGYPEITIDEILLRDTIEKTYQNIKQNYIEKHKLILELRGNISNTLNDDKAWWNLANSSETNISASNNFKNFLNNITLNFSDNTLAYQQITSSQDAETHLDNIFQAITHYQKDIENWKNTKLI